MITEPTLRLSVKAKNWRMMDTPAADADAEFQMVRKKFWSVMTIRVACAGLRQQNGKKCTTLMTITQIIEKKIFGQSVVTATCVSILVWQDVTRKPFLCGCQRSLKRNFTILFELYRLQNAGLTLQQRREQYAKRRLSKQKNLKMALQH